MGVSSQSPNQREALTAINEISQANEYLYSTSHALQVAVVSGGGSGTQYAEGSTTAPGIGNLSLGRYLATPPTLTDGQMNGLQLDSAGNLKVTGSLSVGGTTDNSAFTAGTSTGTPAMGFYHSTIDTVTDGRSAVVGITSKRAMLVNLQTAAGAETGVAAAPLQVSLANTGSNATAINVSAASLPLPSGAATSSNQTSGSQKSQIVDGSGNVIGSTSNALDVNIASTNGDIIYDANNSTSVALGSSATFTGTATNVDGYEAVIVQLISDKASATDGLRFETSPDGTNWDHLHAYTYPVADAGVGVHWEESLPGKYFRIVYTNTNSAQTYFRLYTKLLKQAATSHTHPINYDIDINHPAPVTRAVITGETTAGGGGLVNVKVNPSGTLEANVNQSTAANLNATVVGTGTFAVQATLAAETTKVIGTVRTADGSGNLLTSTGNALDVNIKTSAASNISTNLAQVNGVTTLAGNGASGTGAQRVTIASDSTGQVAPAANATSTGATFSYTAALSSTKTAIDANPGNLYGYHIYNPNSVVIYIQCFNLASASVTVGSTSPSFVIVVPAGGWADSSYPVPITFSTALTVAATTTASGSGAPTTGLTTNFWYK